ncbi:MAG: DUF4168 domain-containing protein [Spirochaetaceae bacterium]
MQHRLKSILRVSIVLFLLMGVALTLSAQTGTQAPGGGQGADTPDVDPDSGEFDRFVDALQTVQSVQEDVNEEIDELITESPLSEQDFQQIHQELQGQPDAEGGGGTEVSETEREQYRDLMERIGSTQESSQEEMITAIEDNGLDVNRFNEIMMAARSDAELQQELQQELGN